MMTCVRLKLIFIIYKLISVCDCDVLHLNKLINLYDLQIQPQPSYGYNYEWEQIQHQPQPPQPPPPPPLNLHPQDTTNNIPNEPFLPEIIVNRAAANSIIPIALNHLDDYPQNIYNNQYFNNNYLPPPPPPPPSTTVSTTTINPFQSDEISPGNSYLPPYPPFFNRDPSTTTTTEFPSISNEYLPSQNEYGHGYNYLPPSFIDRKTTTTTTSTTELPFIPPQSDEFIPSKIDGYKYEPPIKSININNNLFMSKHKLKSSSAIPQSSSSQIITIKDHHSASINGRDLKLNPLKLQINELRCVENGYFKILLTIQNSIDNLPIVDRDFLLQQSSMIQAASSTSVVDNRKCNFQYIKSSTHQHSHVQQQLLFYVTANDFQNCGIVQCGLEHFCLRIRFPQINGMKTISDSILTFQCKSQERTVTKTHSLRFGITDINKARTIGTHVKGGNQQPFRTNIALYRQDINGFTRNLEPGGIVQLGEELMLKIQTKPDDGWNHTKLSDINLQRLSQNGNILNSIQLIKSNGCINPIMRTICTTLPIFEPPLGHRLGFRAVMFQGMKNGDEIIMSVKLIGCMQSKDCFEVDPIDGDCENVTAKQTGRRRRRRRKRSDFRDDQNVYEEEITKISFRVTSEKISRDDDDDEHELNSIKSLNKNHQQQQQNNQINSNQLNEFNNDINNNVIGILSIFATLAFIFSIALIGFYVKYKKI